MAPQYHYTLGVLGDKKGPSFQEVAYLSKQLDSIVYGWPPCLWALPQQPHEHERQKKLTLGQSITVH